MPRQSGIWVIAAAVALLVLAPASASAETLRVVTDVADGTAQPSDFTVHVLSGSEVVASAPGSASGTEFVLNPGVYRLTRSGPDGYARTSSGDCNPGGVVELVEGDATCTLTLDHVTVPEDGCLDYPTFAEPAGLNLVGDAAVVENALHLNPDSGGVGAAWFGAGMPVASGFIADFDFRITGGDAADGLAFVIQDDGLDEVGASGGGIGYQGLASSLAVEFDTWWNGEEPSENHVAVHSLGTEPNSAGPDALLGQPVALDSITDGELHEVRVVYVPGRLEVFVDDLTTPKLTVDVDLADLLALDQGTALVGFTAATGGFVEGHRIERWTFCSELQEPATLHVTTVVENGAWLAEDFTVHVSSGGFDAFGSPQPGSTSGSDFTLDPGEYVVSAPARGYAATFSGDCGPDGAIAVASGESKACTITNRAVPLGPGLVVESYESSRTDGDWGLTESFLTDTRGYLEDPANFGPDGTVTRALQVTPGIRVANDRTLAGVDILFTGWVPGFSYTEAEKEALHGFVAGGGTLVATTDDSAHTMVEIFGLTQGDGEGSPTANTITDTAHPIASGLFGAVTTFNQYFATGHYPNLGQHAREIGRNAQGTTLAVIERGVLGPGAGAAIFVADVDVFSNHGGATDNAALIKNLFAFAAGEGPLPALTVGDASAAEGTSLTFDVALSAPSTRPVRVRYATADETATTPSDYVAAAGSIEFAPGQTSKSVSVNVNGDAAVEADERFRVHLSDPVAARIADGQALGTIVNDDANSSPPPVVQESQQKLPPPEAGEEVNALPKSGTVRVKVAGTNRFVELEEGQQIPVGSVVDTTKGRVSIVAAGGQSADFYDGVFRLTQGKGAKPLTTLTLVEALSCPKAGKAVAAAKKKKRRLWGNGSGNFRTKGKHSAATVVGTRWLVEDRCTSTLTRVVKGRVSVRDFAKKKTVTVRAGKKYVARAKR